MLKHPLIRSVLLLMTIGLGWPQSSVLGAEPRTHWAFLPLDQVTVPEVKTADRVRGEIDRFILQRLEEKGLTLSAEATRTAFVRRVFFDLTGLPPSPEETQSYVLDNSPQADEALLNRLLESPHFGERWGRHWLDNAGYVDVQGLDNDAAIISNTENKWLYRDYVISALNRDLPFDRFLLEQLAGDECIDWRNVDQYTDETQRLLVATGFLRNSADDTSANELNRRDVHHQILERTHEVVANNLLGLTLQCCKCHDHKYEPIPQTDYYRWQAFFQPAFNPDKWLQPAARQLPNVSAAEKKRIEAHNSERDQQIAAVRSQIAATKLPYEQRLKELKLSQLPEPIRADTLAAVQAPANQRNEIQKYLASKFEESLKVKPEEVTAILSEDDKHQITERESQIATYAGQKRTFQHWQAVYDVGPVTPTLVLNRGDPLLPGQEVSPGMLSVLENHLANNPADLVAVGDSSGRRRALAKWLTNPESAAGSLVIRVRVNRIWQQLFGRGIVSTTDNFGVTGAQPTHPQLLEWLGQAFVADGERLKPFLKRIMSSSTYRQSSVRNDEHSQQVDPDNRLLWKQRVRRLESEAVRDSLLAVSGKLDRSVGGVPVPVEPRPDGSFVVKKEGLATPTSAFRRTVYLLSRRNYHPTLLNVFDQPNLATNCSERSISAVVLQSLTMLNDAFVLEQADAFGDRVLKNGDARDVRIASAFELAFSRQPTTNEAEWCAAAMNREVEFHRQTNPACTDVEAENRAMIRICHTLLNTSEFLVIP